MVRPSAPSPVPLSERLLDLAEALAAAGTPEEVERAVVQAASEALGAVAGAVLRVEAADERRARGGVDGQELESWPGGPLDGGVGGGGGPAADALRRREALYFEQEGELVRAYPELEGRTGGVSAVAALPLLLEGEPLGVLALALREPHVFPPEERRFLRSLAAQGALALGRVHLSATLHEQVRTRTRALESARAAAEVLTRLGDALQAAASPEEVARLALERLASTLDARGMNVVRLSGEQLQATAFWGEVPSGLRAFMTRPGLRLADVPNLQRVARTGTGLYFEDYAETPAPADCGAELSGAAEPVLTPRGRLVGFLVTWRPAGVQPWTPEQRDLHRRAAATLGRALARAEAEREREEERSALDAFVAYQEAVGTESDVYALARQAMQVVQAHLAHVSAA